MKSIIGFSLWVYFLFLALPIFASQDLIPPPKTSPGFEIMKSLEGTWSGIEIKDGQKTPVKVQYRLTSGGTAVEEIFSPGTPKEMVSLYTVDGGKLLMTHYCTLGNQPRMKLSESKPGKIKLTMVDATGMESPREPHMGGLALTLKGKNKLIHEWIFVDPEGKKKTSVFNFTREK